MNHDIRELLDEIEDVHPFEPTEAEIDAVLARLHRRERRIHRRVARFLSFRTNRWFRAVRRSLRRHRPGRPGGRWPPVLSPLRARRRRADLRMAEVRWRRAELRCRSARLESRRLHWDGVGSREGQSRRSGKRRRGVSRSVVERSTAILLMLSTVVLALSVWSTAEPRRVRQRDLPIMPASPAPYVAVAPPNAQPDVQVAPPQPAPAPQPTAANPQPAAVTPQPGPVQGSVGYAEDPTWAGSVQNAGPASPQPATPAETVQPAAGANTVQPTAPLGAPPFASPQPAVQGGTVGQPGPLLVASPRAVTVAPARYRVIDDRASSLHWRAGYWRRVDSRSATGGSYFVATGYGACRRTAVAVWRARNLSPGRYSVWVHIPRLPQLGAPDSAYYTVQASSGSRSNRHRPAGVSRGSFASVRLRAAHGWIHLSSVVTSPAARSVRIALHSGSGPSCGAGGRYLVVDAVRLVSRAS